MTRIRNKNLSKRGRTPEYLADADLFAEINDAVLDARVGAVSSSVVLVDRATTLERDLLEMTPASVNNTAGNAPHIPVVPDQDQGRFPNSVSAPKPGEIPSTIPAELNDLDDNQEDDPYLWIENELYTRDAYDNVEAPSFEELFDVNVPDINDEIHEPDPSLTEPNLETDFLDTLTLVDEFSDTPQAHYEDGSDLLDDWLLNEYAITLTQLHRYVHGQRNTSIYIRFLAVLEEFPHASSYQAISRLVQQGANIQEIEACSMLKYTWQEAPWLWLRRARGGARTLEAYAGEASTSLRYGLTWKLAFKLIKQEDFTSANEAIENIWLDEWRMMPWPSMSDYWFNPSARAQVAAFMSYPTFLEWRNEALSYEDPEQWFYFDPADQSPSPLRINDAEGNTLWKFTPKSQHTDSGYLHVRSWAERQQDIELARQAEEKLSE